MTDKELSELRKLCAKASYPKSMGSFGAFDHVQELLDFHKAVGPGVVTALLDELERLRAIVNDYTACTDHAGNCCRDWCDHCQAGAEWTRRACEAGRP